MKMTEESINDAIAKAAEHIGRAKLVCESAADEINRGVQMPGLSEPTEDAVAFGQSLALLCRLQNKCSELELAAMKHQARYRARAIKKAKRGKAARA